LIAGLLTALVPTLATDAVLHATGIFPPLGQRSPDGPLLLATFYRTIYGVAGAYVAARLAPDRPMVHAMVLGVAGFVVSTAGAIATWNGGPAFEPKWYPLALIVLAIPTAWAGGRLFEARSRTPGALDA
jgi:hypothetical protein